MWGVAQVKYANENSWSRGVVSLHTPGWVHLITYPQAQEDLIMMSFPESRVEQVEWLEVRLTPFEKEGNGIAAAKALLDRYKGALYPEAAEGAAPEAGVPVA
ncbi:MAG: hypothetical protein VKP62_02465 [Candidatus Sericytochromatia bacterium]|nr:hypothetical protein [Candidatus Sericytochromatia bacterium]